MVIKRKQGIMEQTTAKAEFKVVILVVNLDL